MHLCRSSAGPRRSPERRAPGSRTSRGRASRSPAGNTGRSRCRATSGPPKAGPARPKREGAGAARQHVRGRAAAGPTRVDALLGHAGNRGWKRTRRKAGPRRHGVRATRLAAPSVAHWPVPGGVTAPFLLLLSSS